MAANGASILIVDDDLDVPGLVAEILASQGHEVRIANDGREGLRMLHERLPDVVILDVEMPHLTGPEMAYRMFIHDAGMENVPVVLVSGVVNLRGVAKRVGTSYFLGKPFGIDTLLEVLQRAMTERTPPTPSWEEGA